MQEIAWYRKYRPVTMDDYMGDDIRTLVGSRFTVPSSRPNVFMLYGNRGCGKTSFARIIAKYYLCEHPVNGEPCENCEICEAINNSLIAGEADVEVPGVVEIDATTANGKEAIQNIIEEALVPPIYTKYKILILDECHMISKAAQNSLLKIIEDVPEHLIVIFATTDPDDVIGTIHSRCQIKIEVKKKTVDEMADRLMYISKQEGLTTSIEALKVIAKKGDRVPRECINLLENVAKTYSGNVTLDNVRKATGTVAEDVYMEYYRSANSGIEDILNFNKKLKDLNISAKDFVSGLTRFTLDCLYIRHAIAIEEYPVEYMKQVNKLFKTYTSGEFDMLLQILEGAFKSIGADESKNELTITLTALRIGKIGLLADGLANEIVNAEKENKVSIEEYRKQASKEINEQINAVHSISPTKEKLSEMISGLKEIPNANILPPITPTNNTEEKVDKNGEFYSSDFLSDMMK